MLCHRQDIEDILKSLWPQDGQAQTDVYSCDIDIFDNHQYLCQNDKMNEYCCTWDILMIQFFARGLAPFWE
jgi:hypothetical protein